VDLLVHGFVVGVQPLFGSHVLPLHEAPAGFICSGGSSCHSLQTADGSTMTEPALAGAACSTQRLPPPASSGLAAAAG